jgi:high affinity Mn2+ porin
LVITVGNFSVLDFFDKNSFSGDLRRQFFNMAFLTYAAFDFAADARGYAWGAVAEYFHDKWALRVARLTPPKEPNQLPLDFRVYKYYGDQVELEHAYDIRGRDGVIRFLGYRNHENMGRFSEALEAFNADPSKSAANCESTPYISKDPSAPDLCHARRGNVKMGAGVNLEQRVSDSAGVFFRGMVSDGRTEVYSFTSSDRSLSIGAVSKGTPWHRPFDMLGAGFGQSWISKAHAAYLGQGGIDGFIGDGKIRQASEHVAEVFYSARVLNPLWMSVDYQHITNPAYNADRGPVDVFGVRAHTEF